MQLRYATILTIYFICYRQFIEEKFNELLYEPFGEFDNFCRMSYSDFEFLLQKISPMISKQDTDFREAIPAKFRLAITLRFLASGDSYKSLHYLFKVSVSMISIIIREVCRALNEILKDLIKVGIKQNIMLYIYLDFNRIIGNLFYECMLADCFIA